MFSLCLLQEGNFHSRNLREYLGIIINTVFILFLE